MASDPERSLADESAPLTDDEALQALMRQFGPALARYFSRRIGRSDEVRDLVQDVFVRLLRRRDVASMDNASGYVFETAQSVLIDWLRKRQTHHVDRHDSFEVDLHGGVGFDLDYVLARKEELDQLAQALLELPERTRTIFVLRRIEGMKNKEIAKRIGISVSAIEKHLSRTMLHLKRRLQDD